MNQVLHLNLHSILCFVIYFTGKVSCLLGYARFAFPSNCNGSTETNALNSKLGRVVPSDWTRLVLSNRQF